MEGAIAGLLILLVVGVIYFIPTIVAGGKKNAAQVFVLNLFLGWTLIGWVIALVLAVKHEEKN